jgi:DNA-binding transcriptional LysR family regulator
LGDIDIIEPTLALLRPLPWALGKRDAPVPLLTYVRPSETRELAEAALLAARRTWTVAAEGDNLSGLMAAAQAGLGVMALGRNFVPPGLDEVPAAAGLPDVGTLDYVIDHANRHADPATQAFEEILRRFARHLITEHEADQRRTGDG